VNIVIHPKVLEQRPWLSVEDISHAVLYPLAMRARSLMPHVVAGIGFDLAVREIEWLADVDGDDWLIYHAMDNPSVKFRIEVGLL